MRKKKDLLVHFPDDAKAIKRYMRQNKIYIRSIRDYQATSVLQFIEGMHRDPNAMFLEP